MKLVKSALLMLLIFAVCISTTACGFTQKEEIPAEIGKWHTEFKLSDMNSDNMTEEDKALFSLLAGNIVMGIDVEFFEDGSFTYDINTDEIEEAFSKSISTFTSWIFDYDISVFIERLVESALQDVMSSSKMNYLGDYTKSEEGIITAMDGDMLLFRIKANRLIQIDDNGNDILVFTRVDSED